MAAVIVDRGRLLRRLADPGARVILVHGPGGTGKSALVARHAQLLAARGGTVAWLRLVRADQDPIVLIHDIVSAARLRIPDFGSRVTAAMARSRRLERQVSVLTKLLIEDMAQADDLVLVLDGHVRAQPEGPLATFLDELVVAIPEPVRLVLSLRAAPRSRVVAREIAAGAILEIGPTDLAFSPEETTAFLRDASGLDLPDATIERVQAATAGWPLGVRLAATLLRRDPAYDLDLLPSGPSRLIDAIAEGLGGRHGPSVMERLARIAVLDEIAIERVPADEREAVRLLIDELEGGGLLEPDASGRTWRPQPLVAELLRSFAAASHAREDLIGLYRERAERSLEDGDLDRAIEHFQLAGDHDRAARILGDHAERLLSAGEVVRLASWAGGFPRDASRLPWVLLVRGVLRRLDRDYEPALALYRAAEEGFRSANDDAGLARSLIWSGQALRYLRRPRQATALVREGLAAL
ncbi:MAG: AAA family ATPase, partial [Chloroflexota bacterium]